jgi:energy-coupling factor transport system ATP-binding protein
MMDANLSGFASTVRGESFVHGGSFEGEGGQNQERAAWSLVTSLQPSQALRSLSGGETVRLSIACALACRPARLALDCSLEQLDRTARRKAIEEVLQPLSRKIDVAIVDNDPDDLGRYIDRRVPFEAKSGESLNSSLLAFAGELPERSVSAPTIELQDLSFKYSRSSREIFKNASFTFKPGLMYLLKAPNAAGKSTLARLLLGVLKPNRGRFLVDGTPHSPHKRNKNLVFYAFQNPMIQIFGRSVSEYLNALTLASTRRPTWLEGAVHFGVADLLQGFGLVRAALQEPFDLPFIAQKRLSIAAALSCRSPWLFFDEPAMSSDSKGRAALANLFANLCRAGFGLIVVSHGREFDHLPDVYPITIHDGDIRRAQLCAQI